MVGRGFVSAGDLEPGMVIRQISSDVKNQLLSEVSMNALLTVQKLEYGDTPTTVYNFTVADTHTYVVGRSQALVHNTCFKYTTTEAAIKDLAKSNASYRVTMSLSGDIIAIGPNGGKYFAFTGPQGEMIYAALKTNRGKTYFTLDKAGNMNPYPGKTVGFPQIHHIATNKHMTGWTATFMDYFKRANVKGKPDLDINNSIFNRTLIIGHSGKYLDRYHQLVQAKLTNNLRNYTEGSIAYRRKFVETLAEIGKLTRDSRTVFNKAL